KEKLEWERELLGVFLSANPLQAGYKIVAQRITHGLDELIDLPPGAFIKVWGMVVQIRLLTDRQNRPLMFAKIQDHTGSEAEVILIGDNYHAFAHLFDKDALVYVEGSIRTEEQHRHNGRDEEDEYEETQIFVRIVPRFVERFNLDDAPKAPKPNNGTNGRQVQNSVQHHPLPVKPSNSVVQRTQAIKTSVSTLTKLQLILPSHMPESVAQKLVEILKSSLGDTAVEVLIFNGTSFKTKQLPVKVKLSANLYRQLVNLLGEKAIKIGR
ncbi:MAG: DNA polymerase III subunit alpha, partial [Armatimonadetes bacterium]|nr:DNA polymerase III subunit alpha [Armatimonadota bacterium]